MSGQYCPDVLRTIVNTNTLNARNGAGASFAKAGSFLKGQEVFIKEKQNGWCKISMEEKWVKKQFPNFSN